jgi:hypothetical protein
MTTTVGCGERHSDHGDARHLTIDQLEQAAATVGMPLSQVVANPQAGVRQRDLGFRSLGCGRLVRQADMAQHSTVCSGQGGAAV